MSEFLQFLFLGLGKGAIIATLALALVILYRTTGLLNFAQGEMAMFSTYLTWMFWDRFGLAPWLALFASMIVSFGLGAAIERCLIRPVGNANKNPLSVVIVTIGMFLAINSLAQYIWGTNPKQPPQIFPSGSVRVLGADVSYQTLGTLAVLCVLAALLYVLFQKTKIGLAMRGVASNSESSALAGVPVGRVLMLGWGHRRPAHRHGRIDRGVRLHAHAGRAHLRVRGGDARRVRQPRGRGHRRAHGRGRGRAVGRLHPRHR
jgi:branched-chain amino acid transport system permease protein